MSVLLSSIRANLIRYRRSKGLWLMLIIAPIAARLMISDESGYGVAIAVGNKLPVLNSAVIGVWLGIVVSTILLPIAFIYLRANTTRKQPWQIEEVSGANRIAIMLGRFFADATILLLILCTLTMAGIFLGWLLLDHGWNPIAIIIPLWVVAGPALIATAAVKTLFSSLPFLRGAFGEVSFFMLWIAILAIPIANVDQPSNFTNNLIDVGGYIRPLVSGAPEGTDQFAIGGGNFDTGRIDLNVDKGMASEGYYLSRLFWLFLATGLAAIAGILYRPQKQTRKRRIGWLDKINHTPVPAVANSRPLPANYHNASAIGLLNAEARLLLSSRVFIIMLIASALSALFWNYNSIGSAAASLLLIFSLTNHSGRSEQSGYLALTSTMAMPPWHRRIAFVVAGTLIMAATAIPASIYGASAGMHASLGILGIAIILGAVASLTAIISAWLTKSAFVGRIILLAAWYGYFAG